MAAAVEGGVLNPSASNRFTGPVIFDGAVSGVAFGNRTIRTTAQRFSGLHAATTLAWQNPLPTTTVVILRVWLNTVVVSTGACTLDIGVTGTSAATSSDTLLDGVSVATAVLFDSMNAALDSGANAKAQTVAGGKWITVTEASGDATGWVGDLYVEYVPL